jgi:phosphocarrier protein HPr
MLERRLSVVNRLGLHARASARLVQLASEFASTIMLTYRNREINAKSIMGLMMLAAGKGAELVLRVDGTDEVAAADAIEALFARRFDEAE